MLIRVDQEGDVDVAVTVCGDALDVAVDGELIDDGRQFRINVSHVEPSFPLLCRRLPPVFTATTTPYLKLLCHCDAAAVGAYAPLFVNYSYINDKPPFFGVYSS